MFDQVLKKKKDIIAYLATLWIPTKQIQNEELLMLAFVHKSYAADYKDVFTHNERLEFVGDGILALVQKIANGLGYDVDTDDLLTFRALLPYVISDFVKDEFYFGSKWFWKKNDMFLNDGEWSVFKQL